jgi:small subunit ribosomal protein S6
LLSYNRWEGYRTQKEEENVKRYETIFITHPELTEEDHVELEKKLRSTVATWKGDIVKLEDWGTKKLGYEIHKNSRGRYFLLEYLAVAALVRELERSLRLNERILKFQTVKVEERISSDAGKTLKEAGSAEKSTKLSEPPFPPEGPGSEGPEKAAIEGGEGR